MKAVVLTAGPISSVAYFDMAFREAVYHPCYINACIISGLATAVGIGILIVLQSVED